MKRVLTRVSGIAVALALVVSTWPGTATAATMVACQNPQVTPTKTVYLPNITKTLGGPAGWETPFIIQNVGTTSTTIEISLSRFSNGQLVACHRVEGLAAGASFALNPNQDGDLPNDTQFSAVVRSFGAPIVGVVNEIVGSGTRFEASSYVGVSSGATSVFLPNITKRFFGFVTRFVIQNLGSTQTTASADFLSFDGTHHPAPITRLLNPGQSQFIDPNVEPTLNDGTQYSVTVTAGQPIAVRVGTQADDAGVANPILHATMGITQGATTIYGPYAVKNVVAVGKGFSTIVLQNLETTPASLTMTFTPLGGGAPTSFSKSNVPARGAWDFDIRFQNGDAKAVPQVLCGSAASAGCLANGEYSFTAIATTGGKIAAVANIVGSTTLAGYTAIGAPAAQLFLPNITRTLGGTNGWTTPPYIQNTSATSPAGVTLEWRCRTSPGCANDGQLVLTENFTVAAGAAMEIDPRARNLPENTQFSVTATGQSGAQIASIVVQVNFGGGDGAMAYEAFAPVTADPVAANKTRFTGTVVTSSGAPAGNVCVKVGSVPNCTVLTASDGSYSYEILSEFNVSYTFFYLVNGVQKGQQSVNGPYTPGATVNLPQMALLP